MNQFVSLVRAAVIVVAALGGAGATAQKIHMTPKFVNGDAGQFSLVTENSQNIAVPGSPDKQMSTRFQTRLRLSLTDATPEKAVVHITYEQIAFKLDSPGMKEEFDSDWPAIRDTGNMLAALIRSAVSVTLTATVSTADGVGEVEGVDSIVPPAGVKPEQVRQLLNPAGIKEFLSTIYGLKKPGVHEVGESWTIENAVPNMVGVTRFTETHKILRLEGDRAKISITGSGELERKKEGAPGAEFVDIKKATIEGDAEWDTTASCLAKLSQTLVMQVSDDNPVQQGKNMLQTVTTKTVIEKRK